MFFNFAFPIDVLLSVAPPISYFTFPENSDHLPLMPWIIMQGNKDEIVPYEQVVNFVNLHKQSKSNLELFTFDETGHFFHGRLHELKSEIKKHMEPFL